MASGEMQLPHSVYLPFYSSSIMASQMSSGLVATAKKLMQPLAKVAKLMYLILSNSHLSESERGVIDGRLQLA